MDILSYLYFLAVADSAAIKIGMYVDLFEYLLSVF